VAGAAVRLYLKPINEEAMEAFEKMMHGLIALKENGDMMFDTLFIVMPAQELCSIQHTCGGDGTI
jgi:hypothetical protein